MKVCGSCNFAKLVIWRPCQNITHSWRSLSNTKRYRNSWRIFDHKIYGHTDMTFILYTHMALTLAGSQAAAATQNRVFSTLRATHLRPTHLSRDPQQGITATRTRTPEVHKHNYLTLNLSN